MAKRVLTIDPLTRISGLLEIRVEVENNVIINAYSSGMQFRGFERMFQGRPPLDMIYLTSRTCGICSLNHALTSTLALENAFGIIPAPNGSLARKVAACFEMLQNHLRQLCQLVFPDYVNLEGLLPLGKSSPDKWDFRLPKAVNAKLIQTYQSALTFSRKAHKALAAFTGKAPHAHGIFVGGVTTTIGISDYELAQSIALEIKHFTENILMPDLHTIAAYYQDYYAIGKSYGNFLCYGLFDSPYDPIQYAPRGVLISGKVMPVNVDLITENLKYSWLTAPNDAIQPGSTPPIPDRSKEDAYSFVSAPRYQNKPLEGGPLARQFISGLYSRGIATMDRLMARGLEVQKICECLLGFLEVMTLEDFYYSNWQTTETATGIGLTEACRGPLAHFVNVEDGKVKNYSLLPPTTWNLSSMDNKGIHGPAEKALIGTTLNDLDHPVEIGRIIRSFDPCLNCAAHITSNHLQPFIIEVV